MQIKPVLMAVVFAIIAALANASPEYWKREWPNTDFSRTSVSNWDDILSGGPPRDGIPALNNPVFKAVAEEDQIGEREPVITVEIDGAKPRAYPIRYLTWHEIVNDTVAGIPIAVTFCPLCNSGITFDRRVDGQTLTFGVSGKLRNSDMVMFDRETESWWQQAIGQAIVGELNGSKLHSLPTWMESWAEFKARNPQGLVMAKPTAYQRAYGKNPYAGYDSMPHPFLFNGENPPHGIPPLVRVVRVGERAWPLTRLSGEPHVEEAGVVITWTKGQASALDTDEIANGKDVGSIRVRDAQGRDVAHDVMFAFAFHAFWPDGTWMLGQ